MPLHGGESNMIEWSVGKFLVLRSEFEGQSVLLFSRQN